VIAGVRAVSKLRIAALRLDKISGQGRRLAKTIKRELRRRPAVEPVIRHARAEPELSEWWGIPPRRAL